MVLPVLLAVALGLVWLLSLGASQLRVVDAARESARALARGDPEAAAIEQGLVAAPGSRIEVVREGDRVSVTATLEARPPGGLFAGLPAATLRATAVSSLEAAGAG